MHDFHVRLEMKSFSMKHKDVFIFFVDNLILALILDNFPPIICNFNALNQTWNTHVVTLVKRCASCVCASTATSSFTPVSLLPADDDMSDHSSGHETPASTSSRQELDEDDGKKKKKKTKGKKKDKKTKGKKKADDSEDLEKKTKKKGFGLLR